MTIFKANLTIFFDQINKMCIFSTSFSKFEINNIFFVRQNKNKIIPKDTFDFSVYVSLMLLLVLCFFTVSVFTCYL